MGCQYEQCERLGQLDWCLKQSMLKQTMEKNGGERDEFTFRWVCWSETLRGSTCVFLWAWVKRIHCYSFELVLSIQSSIYITQGLNTSRHIHLSTFTQCKSHYTDTKNSKSQGRHKMRSLWGGCMTQMRWLILETGSLLTLSFWIISLHPQLRTLPQKQER